MNKLITPKTRLLEIFEDFPGLEDKLITLIPTFQKLKNPVLRKTVAKIATVQQAAAIANVPVDDLVKLLRKGANQELENLDHNPDNYHLNFKKPNWLNRTRIVKSLDLGPILEGGEHPIHQVVAELKSLQENDILEISAPFLPAPLIDKGISLGFDHFVENGTGGSVQVFFIRINKGID
jgi:hypothetical protein